MKKASKIIRRIARRLYKLGYDPTRATEYAVIEEANSLGLRDYDIGELVAQVRAWRD